MLFYRKSIFVFLSNTGGKEITEKVHQVWLSGKQSRSSLRVSDFERLIESGAFNKAGNFSSITRNQLWFLRSKFDVLGSGLYQSHLIDKSLIDVYVPFLPMEKIHVELCAENEFKKQKYQPKDKTAALK